MGIDLEFVKDLNDVKFCKEAKTIIGVDIWKNSLKLFYLKIFKGLVPKRL